MLSARSEVHFIALFHQTLFASFSFVAFLPGFCFAAHLFVFLRNAFCSSLRLDCCVCVAFYKKMKRAKKSPTNLLFFDAFCSFFAVVLFLLYCMFTFIIFTCSDRCNGSSLVLVGFFSRCFCRLRQPKDYKRLTGTAYKTENGYNNEQKWCRCDKVENKKLTTEKKRYARKTNDCFTPQNKYEKRGHDAELCEKASLDVKQQKRIHTHNRKH